jgi:Zn finger protein HypA/HybF involved in hydrogenase expression
MPSENTLKISPVADTEAERECDSCDDTVDDSGVKIVALVDGRTATYYLCEDCFSNELDVTESKPA